MVAKDREVIEKLVVTGNRLRETIDQKKLTSENVEAVTRDLYSVIEELRLVTSGFKIDDGNSTRSEENC
jgi:hypothetical protein